MGDAVGGSWRRVLIAAGAAVLIFGAVVGVAATGRLGDLRYTSFPGHPYPPSGYYINPFNAQDKGDLINAADAAKVRADLVADGKVELEAEMSGDATQLIQGDGGKRLQILRDRIASNSARGLRARFENKLSSTVIGRLTDPNDPAVAFCAEERGQSTLTTYRISDGTIVTTRQVRVDGKFWLKKVDGRYLIVDALITNTPLP